VSFTPLKTEQQKVSFTNWKFK